MKINQKLSYGFLVISFLILVVSYISLTIQRDITKDFQRVGGEILPGTIALTKMEAEFYHILLLMSQSFSGNTINNKKKLEKSLTTLEKYKN